MQSVVSIATGCIDIGVDEMGILSWFGRREMEKNTPQLMVPTTQAHGAIFNAVVQFLQEKDWSFQQYDGGELIRIHLTGKKIVLNSHYLINDEMERLIFFTRFPVTITEDRRDEVMRLITRINWRLGVGSYEMDLDDGEVSFRSSVDLEGMSDFYPIIENLTLINLRIIDQQSDSLLRVAAAGMGADESYQLLYPEE